MRRNYKSDPELNPNLVSRYLGGLTLKAELSQPKCRQVEILRINLNFRGEPKNCYLNLYLYPHSVPSVEVDVKGQLSTPDLTQLAWVASLKRPFPNLGKFLS